MSRHRPRAWIDRIGGGNSEHLVRPARRRGSRARAVGQPLDLLLLPYAMQTGERIDLELPVDPLLLENARQLVDTWRSWYPELKPPEIHAPARRATATAGRIAQFFSGGVDSWFTLLRHTESTPRFPQVGEVDDLITVWGFDIPIGRADEFGSFPRACARSPSSSASATSSRLQTFAIHGRRVEGRVGTALGIAFARRCPASVALFCERSYAQVKIGSSCSARSNSSMGIAPDDRRTVFDVRHFVLSTITRLQPQREIERIAESDYAISKLKVCYADGMFRNCSPMRQVPSHADVVRRPRRTRQGQHLSTSISTGSTATG